MYARGWSRGAVLLVSVLLASCASSPESLNPATVSRTISQAEVDALLLGQGMGMAAAAEINGYPGPRHALDLKEELNLTPDQRFAISRLMGATLGQTRALGQRIVDAERRLDTDMATGQLSSDQVKARLENIASLRAQLRFTHIDAHLKTKKILTQDQVARYYELRGREVVLPEPGPLPKVTGPLTLPAATTPPVQDEMPQQLPASGPVAVPMPALAPDQEMFDATPAPLPETAPPLMQEETFKPEAVEEATFELEVESASPVAPPVEAPQGLTPGMQDALDEAEHAPVTIEEIPAESPAPVVEKAPQLPPPQEVVIPAAPAQQVVAPGVMQEVAPALPAAPAERVAAPVAVPAIEPAAVVVSPGASDALDVAEPFEPASAPPAEKTAAPASISPGMQDAMELAEPLPAAAPLPVETEEGAVHISPLEEETLEELPPVDPQEPVLIDLDN